MNLALLAVVLSLASALAGLLAPRASSTGRRLSFTLLGASGLVAIAAGVVGLGSETPALSRLPLGLPWFEWQLRLDALSGFFLVLLGLVLVPVSIYGPGYTREYAAGQSHPAVLQVFTGLFVAGMQLVLLADDAFVFMVAWEVMSLASYFLVVFEHQHAANRRAAFLYLLMAHAGALAILLAFGVLAGVGGDFGFHAMRGAPQGVVWGSVAFALALAGFGMKAGLVPLHAWLPEAHPVAPAHVSALMSGVMLKVAVYGFVRVTFDLLTAPQWGWGVAALAVGASSALIGVLFALLETDLKRVLAWSSVENVGIVFVGLGFSLLFAANDAPVLAALGLIAALFHAINHALFKSLLFLGAGAIAHTSHESNIEHMGGLIHRMPMTAVFFLVGCVSISSLPPLNGFVSEWLTFQTVLQVSGLESGALRAILPFAAAVLALTGALAAACFVKVFGLAFLGVPRTRHVRHAHEVEFGMRTGQALLATCCFAFGVMPVVVVDALQAVAQMLLGSGLAREPGGGWLWLTPVAPEVASYSAPLVLLGIALAALAIALLRHRQRRTHPVRISPPWDCGFGVSSPHTQYTATAFAMPFRRIFKPLWVLDESVQDCQPGELAEGGRRVLLRHNLLVGDRVHAWLYQPITRAVHWGARQVARLQTGRIRGYLAQSFVTLLIMLWVVT